MVRPGSSPAGIADALGATAARLAATAVARAAAAQRAPRRDRAPAALDRGWTGDNDTWTSWDPDGATHAGTVVTSLTLGPIRQFVNNF